MDTPSTQAHHNHASPVATTRPRLATPVATTQPRASNEFVTAAPKYAVDAAAYGEEGSRAKQYIDETGPSQTTCSGE